MPFEVFFSMRKGKEFYALRALISLNIAMEGAKPAKSKMTACLRPQCCFLGDRLEHETQGRGRPDGGSFIERQHYLSTAIIPCCPRDAITSSLAAAPAVLRNVPLNLHRASETARVEVDARACEAPTAHGQVTEHKRWSRRCVSLNGARRGNGTPAGAQRSLLRGSDGDSPQFCFQKT